MTDHPHADPDGPLSGWGSRQIAEYLDQRRKAPPITYSEAMRALNECADDLEAELRARYPKETIEAYPSERRRFERDMRSVLNARLAINGLRSHGMGWPAGEGSDE